MTSSGQGPVQVVVASAFGMTDAHLLAEVKGIEVVLRPELLGPVGDAPLVREDDAPWRRTDDQQAQFEALLAGAEVVIGLPDATVGGLAGLVRMAPALRWVQGAPAGTGEFVRRAGLTPQELRRVVITSGAGLYSAALAEWAMLGLLTFAKDVPRLIADRAAGMWQPKAVGTLAGRRLLIVGLGDIGRETARLAQGFGMTVTGVRRNPGEVPPGVDRLAPLEALPGLMAEADAVVLALPATAETIGLLSRELIAALPTHAVVVNVGRGVTIDEPALIDALRERRLAGAALDVTAVEPLPGDSELWTLPNVLLSPHSAAVIAGRPPKLLDLIADNLRRYVAGQPLRNVVDTVRFY